MKLHFPGEFQPGKFFFEAGLFSRANNASGARELLFFDGSRAKMPLFARQAGQISYLCGSYDTAGRKMDAGGAAGGASRKGRGRDSHRRGCGMEREGDRPRAQYDGAAARCHGACGNDCRNGRNAVHGRKVSGRLHAVRDGGALPHVRGSAELVAGGPYSLRRPGSPPRLLAVHALAASSQNRGGRRCPLR